MEVQNASDMMEQVVSRLISQGQVSKSNEDYLKNALLLRHRYWLYEQVLFKVAGPIYSDRCSL